MLISLNSVPLGFFFLLYDHGKTLSESLLKEMDRDRKQTIDIFLSIENSLRFLFHEFSLVCFLENEEQNICFIKFPSKLPNTKKKMPAFTVL